MRRPALGARRSIVIASLASASPALALMFVRAAVTQHTVVEIANAFLHMFAADLPGRVCVAAVAAIAAVVVGTRVARRAAGMMVAV